MILDLAMVSQTRNLNHKQNNKIDRFSKVDFMKIGNFGASKDITNKMEKKTNLMEKYFQIMYLMKDLYLENECKQLLELNNKKIHNCAQKKETINKMAAQKWEKIFANGSTRG